MAGPIRNGFKAFLITLFITACIGLMFGMVVATETPKGAVTGMVVHRDQEVYKGPIPGARVTISGAEDTLSTTTDSEGKFRFTEVPAGTYWVSAEAPHRELVSTLDVVVKEARTSKVKPLVMRTRPPNLGASLRRSVFIPGDKVKLNLRGYSSSADTVHIALFPMNVREFFSRSGKYIGGGGPFASQFAGKTPIAEWDEPIKRDFDGDFSRQAVLPAEAEGGYYFRTRMGDQSSDGWFTISSLGLIAKSSPGKVLLYCVDLKSGRPAPGARVSVFSGGSAQSQGVTDADGLYLHPSPVGEEASAVAESGDSIARTGAGVYSHTQNLRGVIYTDRPVYRPGHKVFIKGVVRRQEGAFFRSVPGETVDVKIEDPSGKTVKTMDLTTSRFGTWSAEFQLGEEPPLGGYSVMCSPRNEAVGEGISGDFEVAEYRKPDFIVGIKFDRDYFIAGTSIKGEVNASYYFGAPVADARVTYTVYKSPSYDNYDFEDEFLAGFYESIESNYRTDDYGYGEMIVTGEGRTDENGRLRLDIPTERYADADSSYTVEVNVMDQSLRTISSSASVLVPRGLFNIVARTKDNIYLPGTPAEVSIEAVDHEDRPKAGVNLKITVEKQVWEGKEEHRRLRYRRVADGEAATGADGKAVYRFTPRDEGSFRVRVEARDRMDNLIRGYANIWVASEDYASDGYRGAELEIIRDKKVHQVGETARIIINSSVNNVYALLTVEGRELFERRLIYLKNNTTTVTLPARQEYVSNAFISVCYVDRQNLVQQTVPFYVSPEFKFLNVDIQPDKEIYKPGEAATYRIRTTDLSGRPVSAEVSLGIVDESVYAIMEDRTPDMRQVFYGPRWNQVETSHSFPDYYLGGADKETFGGKVRKYFPDTAFWSPDLVTGEDGYASVSMVVPDSLTTWRATARAVTEGTDVGSAVRKVKATKDLIVRLQTPRFITQKDELSIGATLHNYTDRAQQVKVWIDVEGIRLQGELRRTVNVDPGSVVRFDWPVAASTAGTAQLTVYAQGETDSDAMELEIPVLPHGLNRIETAVGAVDREGAFRMDIAKGAIPETVRMEVMITPTAAGSMLGALDYLKNYEYGCMEQTVSRFLPWLTVAGAFRRLSSPDPEIEKRLPEMVNAGLARLYGFQNRDGGWGWWNDESSPYTTAYVVYGLTMAKQAGFPVQEESLQRGLHSLESQVGRLQKAVQVRTPDEPPYANPTERAYMVFSLALNGRARPDHLEQLMSERKKMTSYGRSLLALSLYEAGNREWGDKVSGELLAESKLFKGLRHWEVDEENWRWEDSSVEATAYALRALLRRDPSAPEVEEAVRWLALKRDGDHWVSTKQTAAVVYALAESITLRTELANPSYTAEVLLNGKSQGSIRITEKDVLRGNFTLAMRQADIREGGNELTIRKTGEGPLYYSAVARYFSLEEDIRARSSGLKITRDYSRFNVSRLPDGTMTSKRVPIRGSMKPGDRIVCRLTVESNDNYHYVVVEDPRPAGLEPMEQLSGSADTVSINREGGQSYVPWVRAEVHDEKIAFFATMIPKGKWTTEYELRAEVPGEFHTLPTTAFGMYAPQINGNGAERRIRVR